LEKADFTGKGTAEKARYGKSGVSDRERPSEQFSDGLPVVTHTFCHYFATILSLRNDKTAAKS